jgi:hypothetical protein
MSWIKSCRWRKEALKRPAPDIPTMNESRARSANCGQGHERLSIYEGVMQP